MKFYMVEYEYFDMFAVPQWQFSYYALLETGVGVVITGDDREDLWLNITAEDEVAWLNGYAFRNRVLTYIGMV